jgi:hypothetical protein
MGGGFFTINEPRIPNLDNFLSKLEKGKGTDEFFTVVKSIIKRS